MRAAARDLSRVDGNTGSDRCSHKLNQTCLGGWSLLGGLFRVAAGPSLVEHQGVETMRSPGVSVDQKWSSATSDVTHLNWLDLNYDLE